MLDHKKENNVLIIGTGIAGLLSGYFLSLKGVRCTFIEKSSSLKEGCSYMAAGMLAPLCEVEVSNDFIYQLGQESLTLWESIESHIGSCDRQQNGTIIVWHKEDYSDALRFFNAISYKHNGHDIEKIDYIKLSTMEKDLTERFSEGFYIPHEGGIDPRITIQRLYDFLKERATFKFNHTITAFSTKDGSVTIQTPEEELIQQQYDFIIDCRGSFAKDTYTDIRGIKGEAIIVHAPEVHFSRPIRLMHPRYPLYIMPRQDHHYLIGATQVENENKGVTLISALELLTGAYSIHSGFAEAQIVELIHQFRPTLKNGDPKAIFEDKCLHINGFYRHGYLIGPSFIKQNIEKVFS